MKNKKLTFRFHNPNTAEATADHVLKVCIQAARPKLDEALREAGLAAASRCTGEIYENREK